jgi:hypothetical protein
MRPSGGQRAQICFRWLFGIRQAPRADGGAAIIVSNAFWRNAAKDKEQNNAAGAAQARPRFLIA